MDGDIEELFESLIKKYREQDAAFDELKLMMDEDEELKKSYEEWCAAMWDSIFPNKEEYDGYDS